LDDGRWMMIAVRSFSHRSLPRGRFLRDLNLKLFEFWMCWSLFILAVCVCVCVFVASLFFGWQDGGLWRLQPHCSRLLCTWKWHGWCCFIENGCPALKQRESISFWWFLAHQDDFAQLKTTNIFFKAEKAQSYSSLHALSNGAKHCAYFCWKSQEKGTARGHCPLSIVIGNPLSFEIILALKFWFLNFIVSKTPQRANKKPYRHGTDAPRHYPHTLITNEHGILELFLSRCDLFPTAHYLVCVFRAIWIWNLKFECIGRSLFWMFVCRVAFLFFGWHHGELCWALQHPSRLLCVWKWCRWGSFIMENGCPALKQRESIPFCDFWHINDDFAIKNAAYIIFKAEKAPSYSSLHALSNDAKRCTCLGWNRQANATARGIVHCHWKSIVHHSKSF
jgi:hypothetical protein